MDWNAILIAMIASGVLTTLMNLGFEKLRNDREIKKHRDLQGFNDRLVIYRLIVDMTSEILAEIVFCLQSGQKLPHDKFIAFDKTRMKTFGYLCVYASQESIDAHERMIEYILDVVQGKNKGEWPEVRDRVIALLNTFREDYDSSLPKATYNGNR